MEKFLPKSVILENLHISSRTLELWVANKGFPKPRKLAGSRLAFFAAYDVQLWLDRQLSGDQL